MATLEAGRLQDPPHHGRDVLKGRALVRERSISLAGTGLSCGAIACIVGEPYSTVYTWLRRAGVATSRAEWREAIRRG